MDSNEIAHRNPWDLTRFGISSKQQIMKYGDYSIAGFLKDFRIERKTAPDFLSSISTSEKRQILKERLSHMNNLPSPAYLIIEGNMSIVTSRSPLWSKVDPRTVMGTITSWQLEFKNVLWQFASNKFYAEFFVAKLVDQLLTDSKLSNIIKLGRESKK